MHGCLRQNLVNTHDCRKWHVVSQPLPNTDKFITTLCMSSKKFCYFLRGVNSILREELSGVVFYFVHNVGPGR